MALQEFLTQMSFLALCAFVNKLGLEASSGYGMACKIVNFAMLVPSALMQSMASFVSQNVGAGKLDRLGQGLRSAVILGAVYSAIILLVLIVFGQNLVYLFVDPKETVVVAQARQFLITNAVFYVPLALVNIVRFLIQGMGFSGFAVFAGVFEMIARALVGLAFVPLFGYSAACFASPLAWIFADCFLIPAFFHCRKKLMQAGSDQM